METVMSHEFGFPFSLFCGEESVRKTAKADVAKKMKTGAEEFPQLPN